MGGARKGAAQGNSRAEALCPCPQLAVHRGAGAFWKCFQVQGQPGYAFLGGCPRLYSEAVAGGRGAAPARNPSPQGSGEANRCFQCLETAAEFSHKSLACHVQIWIGLIKKPQQQPEFRPAVSPAGARSPGTVCQSAPKCKTRSLHASDPSFGLSPVLLLSQPSILGLGLRGSGAIGGWGRQLEPHVNFSPLPFLLHPEIYNRSDTATTHSHGPGPGSKAAAAPQSLEKSWLSQGGPHCCSLVRKGQGFWDATCAHGIGGGDNDATTLR